MNEDHQAASYEKLELEADKRQPVKGKAKLPKRPKKVIGIPF